MIYEAESRGYLLICTDNSRLPPLIETYEIHFSNEILLSKVTGISENQLLVAVLPGVPTTAEIFIVSERASAERQLNEKWVHLSQVLSLFWLIHSVTERVKPNTKVSQTSF